MITHTSWFDRTMIAGAWGICLFMSLPILIVFPVSLTPTDYISMPSIGDLTTRHFEALVGPRGWMGEAGTSLVIALAAATTATALGTASAIGLWLITNRWTNLIRIVLLIPLMVPQILAGLAFYRLTVSVGLYDTYIGVIVAHAILALPFVFITVSSALTAIDRRMIQAAHSLGAGACRAVFQVILPNTWRGVLSGGVLAFVLSWDEIVVTLFITSRDVFTLPRRIWDGIRETVDPTVAAAASALVIITILLFGISALLQPRNRLIGD
jgi:putative spermidine/putrescine transport system permease protein